MNVFWIFICLVFCPVPSFVDQPMFGLSSVNNKLLFKAAIALILYTSGVIAEIVRGGLNSVPHGQIEAGHSQGFSMVQIMWYIVLPQTFKAIIPTLLSQVITTIKDSSFLANVAVIELMSRTKQILSAANRYKDALYHGKVTVFPEDGGEQQDDDDGGDDGAKHGGGGTFASSDPMAHIQGRVHGKDAG